MRHALAAMLFFAIVSAQATVIDFESAVTSSTCGASEGGSIDGFTLSDGQINNDTACSFVNPAAYSGDNYMLNYNSRIALFTKDEGSFTLDSVFVHADIRSPDATVRFQGLDGVGGSILYTMDVDITATWEEVVFIGWDNVKTFTWDSVIPGTSNISIDNIAYTVVPIPAAVWLFGSALAGLGWLRRKQTI
jgi:hypothetical protein